MIIGEQDLNPPIKRLLAFAGSVVAGLFGAIVLASPAQAHHTEVTGSVVCLPDGQYKTVWTVTNGNFDNPIQRITEVTFKIDDVATADTLKVILKNEEIPADGSLSETVFLPGTAKKAWLQVKAVWLNNGNPTKITDTKDAKVTMLGGCQPAKAATGEPSCTTFDVTVTNSAEGQKIDAKVTYGTQVIPIDGLPPGESKKVSLTPSSETVAVVSFANSDFTVKVPYSKPANCGGLPQTGSSTASIMASGAGLAGLGVFVFFMARRRMARLRRLASE